MKLLYYHTITIKEIEHNLFLLTIWHAFQNMKETHQQALDLRLIKFVTTNYRTSRSASLLVLKNNWVYFKRIQMQTDKQLTSQNETHMYTTTHEKSTPLNMLHTTKLSFCYFPEFRLSAIGKRSYNFTLYKYPCSWIPLFK